jgi:poly(hydroxyalkanoate) depolymerase family esterase
MNEQMRTGMLEASRLTRAGRLLEATATIQRTLRGVRAPHGGGEPSDQPADEVIEGDFWVSDPVPHSTQAGTQESEHRPSASIMTMLPPPNAPPPRERDDSSAEQTSSEASPRAAPSASSDLFCRGERTATTPPASRPLTRQDRTGQTAGNGGQFLSASYSNAAGSRAYKLYIPSGYRGQALPLVVMLHGCTQTPEDFAVGTRMNERAEEQLFFVAYPAQAPSANRSKCWNWFKGADQSRDQGEPSLIAGITHQIESTYAVESRRVYVAGLSAGGAMAVILGTTYPELYAAIGIHSGLAYGSAHDLPSALAAMQHGGTAPTIARNSGTLGATPNAGVVPMIVFHGDRDTTVHPRNADQLIAQWAAFYSADGSNRTPEVTVQRGQVRAGQAYTRAIYHDRNGQAIMEQWLVHGAGHAWSGGSASGSFTNPSGPDATQEMLRFFAAHSQGQA